jgi:hypothetical protein
VFGGFRGDLVQLAFPVSTPLPRGNEVAPHARDSTRCEGNFN